VRYFANPSTEPVRDAMRAGLLGLIATPRQGNNRLPGVAWCADNGCYSRGYPGDQKWLAWLARNAAYAGDCVFAVAPDVPTDASATLARSCPWLHRIRALGYPAALVAQDGRQHLPIPWDEFNALFLGGTTAWKLGPAGRHLTAQATERGMPVHMGRVNSARRLRYAQHIGCASADGTYLTYAPDTNLPKLLAWLRQIDGHAAETARPP
jgi:hypothetical protein